MAHANICERRAHVARLLSEGAAIDEPKRKEIARLFGCSTTAIRADELSMREPLYPATHHVSTLMRRQVRERDDGICQYCSRHIPFGSDVAEHVIPACKGGVARLFNLVLACQSCNVLKGSDVWRPENLATITKCHPEWRRLVESMSDSMVMIRVYVGRRARAIVAAQAHPGAWLSALIEASAPDGAGARDGDVGPATDGDTHDA